MIEKYYNKILEYKKYLPRNWCELKAIICKKYEPKVYVVATSILLIIFATIYHFVGGQNINDKSIQVIVVPAKTDDVPVFVTAIGNVTPENSVILTARAAGQLAKVSFNEGQKVQKGDLLAEIDPSLYHAQVVQYEGQLARDKALLDNAKLDLSRYQELWKQNSVSKQELDTQVSQVKQHEGIVKIDEGLLETAKANLGYCKIVSPINGQIGLRQIDPGNNVAITSQIAVINKIDPIYVIFSIPENEINNVAKSFRNDNNLEVIAYDPDQTELLANGKLLAIDNQINLATGTVNLKAIFDNAENNLFPNQFVNIKLKLSVLKDALVIPIKAVQHGKEGDYVYKVVNEPKNKKIKTVKIVNVKVSQTKDEYIVVESGLEDGDKVVTEGTDKLTDGSEVKFSKDESNS